MSKFTGYGAPTDETVGAVGDIYINSNNGVEYECVAIREIKTDTIQRYYLWVRAATDSNSGGGTGGTVVAGLPNDEEQIGILVEVDMLPAVHGASGAILTDDNGNIVLRY